MLKTVVVVQILEVVMKFMLIVVVLVEILVKISMLVSVDVDDCGDEILLFFSGWSWWWACSSSNNGDCVFRWHVCTREGDGSRSPLQ